MKKFVAPLQAIALLLFCSGLSWMVFVLASINPTPPTVMDLQARNTQDLSFVSLNSTAVALAKQILDKVVPSPTGPYFLTVKGRETATPGPAAMITLKPVFSLFEVIHANPLLYSLHCHPKETGQAAYHSDIRTRSHKDAPTQSDKYSHQDDTEYLYSSAN